MEETSGGHSESNSLLKADVVRTSFWGLYLVESWTPPRTEVTQPLWQPVPVFGCPYCHVVLKIMEREEKNKQMRLEILCKTHALPLIKIRRGGNHILCAFEKNQFVSAEFDWTIKDAFLSIGVVFDGWEVSCLMKKTREKCTFVINMVILFSASNKYESALLVVKSFELPTKRWWLRLFILKKICYRKKFLKVLGLPRPSRGCKSKKRMYRSREKYSKIYYFVNFFSLKKRSKQQCIHIKRERTTLLLHQHKRENIVVVLYIT